MSICYRSAVFFCADRLRFADLLENGESLHLLSLKSIDFLLEVTGARSLSLLLREWKEYRFAGISASLSLPSFLRRSLNVNFEIAGDSVGEATLMPILSSDASSVMHWLWLCW